MVQLLSPLLAATAGLCANRAGAFQVQQLLDAGAVEVEKDAFFSTTAWGPPVDDDLLGDMARRTKAEQPPTVIDDDGAADPTPDWEEAPVPAEAQTEQAQPQQEQVQPEQAQDPCGRCQLTVDLKCIGLRPSRSAPFHRIQDCLVPLYGLIDIARNASRRGKRVCAVTWLDIWEGLNLNPFLVNLTGVPWTSIINEREECGKKLEYHAIKRTRYLAANQEWLDSFGSDPLMVQAHPVDIARNLHSLAGDVARVTGDYQPGKLIVLSRNKGTRKFRTVALQELIGRLEVAGLPIEKYSGKESALETIKMFSAARGVFGYHGAAWVNTYFAASNKVCSVEVSTFYDLESQKPWRTSMEVGLRRHNVLWYFYLLPLNLLLDSNHVQHDAYLARQEKDHFIKDFEWIPMRDVDIESVTSHLTSCLADPDMYERAHPDHASKYNSIGWEQQEDAAPSQVSGRLASAGRDACSGCDVTVDLRCEGSASSRGTYYGSVAHCLLPAYEMLQVAREAASNSSANVCAITYEDGFSLRPFLRTVTNIKWYKLLDADDRCVEGLRYHTFSWSTQMLQQEATKQKVESAERLDAHTINSYPVDIARNRDWLQKDCVNVAGKPKPHIVVLQSLNRLELPQPTLELLTEKLSKFMAQPVTVFNGNQEIVDTVKLFANVGSVVGFHNSLWVNTLFTYTPHCLVEISTYQDLEKKKEWRTNAEIQTLNPVGDWHFVHVRLQQLLAGNNLTAAKFSAAEDKDAFILNMPLAPVLDEDAMDVASRIYLCWQNKQRAYTFFTDTWNSHGHA